MSKETLDLTQLLCYHSNNERRIVEGIGMEDDEGGGIAEEVLLVFDDGFRLGRSEKPKKTDVKQLELKV